MALCWQAAASRSRIKAVDRAHSLVVPRDRLLATWDRRIRVGDLAFDKRFGSSPLEFRLAKGSKETDAWFGTPCWTVNASSKPIRLVEIEYPTAYAHFKETESIAVLPGERVWGCFYDYRGPEFAPPDTMQSMAFARMDFAEWLTWDP